MPRNAGLRRALQRLEEAAAERAERAAMNGDARERVLEKIRLIRERRLAAMTPEERAAWEAEQATVTLEERRERIERVKRLIAERYGS
ncbi:MAG: hypothetical protein M3Q65_14470 [Chloroflexota bacterium]|nr:hypothetical protein [Chloroflexota bacterium]